MVIDSYINRSAVRIGEGNDLLVNVIGQALLELDSLRFLHL